MKALKAAFIVAMIALFVYAFAYGMDNDPNLSGRIYHEIRMEGGE